MFGRLFKRLLLLSPYIEISIRRCFWNHFLIFDKIRKVWSKISNRKLKGTNSKNDNNKIEIVIDYLKESGIKSNDIIIIHSSFDSISGLGLQADQIIELLSKELVPNGTIVMPAIRSFKEEGKGIAYLENYISDIVPDTTLYNVMRTPVSSGLLPFTLMRFDEAIISDFPLNPVVALGKEAKQMVNGNVDGKFPSAHGHNSAWRYCADRNAWNIGLGVDKKDYLTLFHVAQENEDWPVKDWFFHRNFTVKHGRKENSITVNERSRKWTKYYAETNFYNDLLNNKIMSSMVIENIPILLTRSSDLLTFMKSQKNKTYPYYLPKKYLK